MTAKAAITIGNFDGVHAGHRALLDRARQLAGPAGRVVALAFDPHPMTTLAPDRAPPRLTTFDRKRALLLEAGADDVVRLTPDKATLAQSPEEFADRLVRDFAPAAIVEGPDFRFGRGRAGDNATLAELGRSRGFTVEIVPPVEVAMTDMTLAPASSSLARWLLAHGRVTDAAAVLGRPYMMEGVVVEGDRRGRTIGFPTANLRSECLAPGDGVYAGFADLDDGRRFSAAISVGTKPMFNGASRAVEAFLMDAPSVPGPCLPGLPEYGWNMRLSFVAWLRDQGRFESVTALIEQMKRDCGRVPALTGRTRATEVHA